MKRLILATCLAVFGCTAFAQSQPPTVRREPLSPVLLDHFYKQIHEWDRGAPGPNASSKAFTDMDFLTKTRVQLQQAGTAAFPIAPKVAELMVTSEKNRYMMAYMLMAMTPPPAEQDVPALVRAAAGTSSDRLVAYAQLARTNAPAALAAIRNGAGGPDIADRLMATVALGYMGNVFPDDAALAIAKNLKDQDKSVRNAAANGLRMIGAAAQAAAPQLLEYLRTRDNPYMATAALKNFPVALVRSAKGDLEGIIADPKLNTFQKQDAVDLLVRIETQQ